MNTNTRNQIDPTAFFDGDGRFQAFSFAEEIAETYTDRQDRPIFAADESNTLYVHNGRVWDREGESVLRDEARAILRDAASSTRVNEVVKNVASQTRTRRQELLDLDPDKLVLQNGVVDLRTGEFSRDYGRPGTLTWIDVEYNRDARPEQFDAFLQDVLAPEDVSIMWEVIGYCLYRGYPFQKAVMLLGEGANGKSTLLAALRDFLGKRNVAAKELQSLAENRFAVADLEGKLANIAPDISDEDLGRTGTFKALTGGDLITAERKYQDPFEFENAATLIFSANRAPSADDDTHAYERRWLYFKFPNRFDPDDPDTVPQSDLLDAFRNEHGGILNRAVEAFGDLWARGGFEITAYMEEKGGDAHKAATNPMHEFVSDEIVEAEGELLRIKDAYEAYEAWSAERDHQVQGRRNHFEPAVRREYTPSTGKDPADGRSKVWHDLSLRSEHEAAEGQTRL